LGHSIRTQKIGIVTRITEQLERLRGRIQNAAERSGRGSQGIRIVAVSKKHRPSAIREAQAAGLTRFGENYLQEAVAKIAEVGPPAEWHFIGPVQSNKAGPVAANFDWVHTLSTERVARRLSARRQDAADALQVCLQLRPAGAPDRAGIDEDGLAALAALIEELPNLNLRGLMMMPLPGDVDDSRREFARAKAAFDRLRAGGHDVDTLSMGMSGDLEAAIMEGSNMVRIGTDIFGPRIND